MARTASHALNNVVLPYIEQAAAGGRRAFRDNRTLRSGVYLYRGRCTHAGLAGMLGWECAGEDWLND